MVLRKTVHEFVKVPHLTAQTVKENKWRALARFVDMDFQTLDFDQSTGPGNKSLHSFRLIGGKSHQAGKTGHAGEGYLSQSSDYHSLKR